MLSPTVKPAPMAVRAPVLVKAASHNILSTSSRRASIALAPLTATSRSARAAGRRSVSVQAFKVSVLGAAGGIGQPLALLLKLNRLVTGLSLYDIAPVTAGVAVDLSHINSSTKVDGFAGAESLASALSGADLVVIPAGVPRKPGMTRDDLFNINAGIVKTLIEACAKNCPKAVIAIISNPVNSTVPIAVEVLKKAGVYDKRKVLGVTTLDVVRANTFVSAAKGLDLEETNVPVVGGHAGITILPLLSQTSPPVKFTEEEVKQLTERIQNAGTEVVDAKAGGGSATLSMAYAAARFTESILNGLRGEPDIEECAFVESDITELPFFASRVKLGVNGVEEVYGLGELSESEKKGVEELIPVLKGNIEKGIEFANA